MKNFFSLSELEILIDLIAGDKKITPFRKLSNGKVKSIICLN
jgi:hypothetical protein